MTEINCRWLVKHNKPIIVTEYGADTVAGLHSVSHFFRCNQEML
jgi:hypothetical protein